MADDLCAGGHLGHPLRHQERDGCATKTDDGRERQQAAQVEAVGSQKAVNTEQASDHGQYQHDRQVGQNEKHDAFHEDSVQ